MWTTVCCIHLSFFSRTDVNLQQSIQSQRRHLPIPIYNRAEGYAFCMCCRVFIQINKAVFYLQANRDTLAHMFYDGVHIPAARMFPAQKRRQQSRFNFSSGCMWFDGFIWFLVPWSLGSFVSPFLYLKF